MKEKLTHIEAVQKAFIAEVSDKGIEHSFAWISSWFTAVSIAQIEDELASLGEPAYAKDKEVQSLVLESLLVSEGEAMSSPGTSVGHNLMKSHRVAELSRRLRKMSHSSRDARWDAVRARFDVTKAAEDITR